MPRKDYLNEINGNYIDTIQNLVYKIQKYSDALTLNYSIEESHMNTNQPLVNFMICESENILKCQMLQTGFDIKNMIKEKYHFLFSFLLKPNDIVFKISPDIYNHFNEYITNKKWDSLNYKVYSNPDIINLYNFENTLKNCVKEYDGSIINYDLNKEINADDLYLVLSKSFKNIMNAIKKLIKKLEISQSAYISSQIIKDMIECVYISYLFISKIQVVNK